MSQAQATAVDRLPWLEDEPGRPAAKPPRRGRGRWVVALAIIGALLVAGVSYWMGAHSWETAPSATQRVPPVPKPAAPQSAIQKPVAQPQVVLEAPPQVTPAPMREVPIAKPRVPRRATVEHSGVLTRESPPTEELDKTVAAQKGASVTSNTTAAPDEKPLAVWPAWQSQGAKGRIVRIGAFGSRDQAKFGWRYMVRSYPAVAHLKATVVGETNSRRRHFYRFQIGTTSQAHSEVLCQRMEKIHLSCAVVGLAWKPGGVER